MLIQYAFPDSYIVFDLETSGLSPRNDDIIQIGILDVEYGSLVDDVHSYIVNPNFPDEFIVPDHITKITGITSKQVTEEGLEPAFIIPLIAEKLRRTPIVSHNGIRFDKPFFDVACARFNAQAPQDWRWLDTAALYKAMQMDLMSLLGASEMFFEFGVKILDRRVKGLKYNLAHCCDDRRIDVSDLQLHRADADCVATYRLFEQLREDLL